MRTKTGHRLELTCWQVFADPLSKRIVGNQAAAVMRVQIYQVCKWPKLTGLRAGKSIKIHSKRILEDYIS